MDDVPTFLHHPYIMSSELTEYVLMPMRGLRLDAAAAAPLAKLFRTLTAGVKNVNLKSLGLPDLGLASLKSLSLPTLGIPKDSSKKATDLALKCLDAISENGAKLVQLSAEAALALRRAQPGMRLAPVMHYRPALNAVPRIRRRAKLAAAGPAVAVKFKVVASDTGKPLPGVRIIAFTNYAAGAGDEAVTNIKGEAKLTGLRVGTKIERLYVEPPAFGYWGFFRKNVVLKNEQVVKLRVINFDGPDGVRHFYAAKAAANDGEGVKVAVVDTGVDGDHPDLRVAGGACTVTGESAADWGPKAGPHGTHVAGIIGSRGDAPKGLRGVAPMVDLLSYRVFGADDQAANFAIAKAIDQAVAAGCDLINLSLKYDGEPDAPLQVDEVIRQALEDAREQGVVVVAATGNDGRKRVTFPAADAGALAVAALGRKGTYPLDSFGKADELKPYGSDKKNFVAAFSNVGSELDLIGPGVDIVSTVPGGYAPMSGTSMAAPAVTGLGARLLSRNPSVRDLPRDSARADAITRLILASCQDLGFEASFQGNGIPL